MDGSFWQLMLQIFPKKFFYLLQFDQSSIFLHGLEKGGSLENLERSMRNGHICKRATKKCCCSKQQPPFSIWSAPQTRTLTYFINLKKEVMLCLQCILAKQINKSRTITIRASVEGNHPFLLSLWIHQTGLIQNYKCNNTYPHTQWRVME